ncbi:Ig-like domain-containing protein [Limnohabitans sp. T6-20]|uniref:Ig-like domain-containing protein n=1 Tax=Limnohabitans sp. T6-20 TaxID=1100725 RepID=UPI0011B21BE6|nr:Ig-like domain-containing protein [Limnohabitans sp. T6-20]
MATEKIAYKLRINVGGDKTSEMQNLSAGKTARIKAQAGVRYQLQDANKNDAPPEQVRVKRVGKDLHVALGEGEEAAQLIIEDYYAVMPEGFNALVGQADGGSFYEYVLEAPTADSYTLSLAEGQDFTSAVLGGSEVSGSGAALAVLAFNPLLAAGAAGAAGAAAAAGGGGATATVDTTPPAAPGLKVDDRDANGKINASGTAEIGSTVTVTWPDGSTSTTTAGPDGTWAIESPTVQPAGTVKAEATDASGNKSDPSSVEYIDALIASIDGNGVVSGTGATPGQLVTATLPNGATATGTAGANGTFTLSAFSPKPTNGETVTVSTGTTAAGNPAGETTTTLAPNTTGITASIDGNGVVSGSGATPGQVVTATLPNGATATGTAGTDGTFTLSAFNPKPANGETVAVSAPTSAGQPAETATTVAPNNTGITASIDGNGVVTGSGATPGQVVTATLPNGATATGTAGTDGTFTLSAFSPKPTNGETVSVSAPTSAGQIAETATTVAPNTTGITASIDANGVVTGSGATPGQVVTATLPNGATATGTAGPNGTFTLSAFAPVPANGETVSVSAPTGVAGQNPETGTTVAQNTTGITASIDASGVVTGSGATPGQVVTATLPNGATATGTAGPNGTFTLSAFDPVPANGETVSVSAPTGVTGQPAETGTTVAQNTTGMTASISPEGVVTGSGATPGQVVTATLPNGATATGTAGPNGTFTLSAFDPVPANGETVQVSAPTGVVGQPAETASALAPNTTGITASISPEGVVTGSGATPGQVVTATLPNGATATGTAGPNGTFTLSAFDPVPANGETVQVSAPTGVVGQPAETASALAPNTTGITASISPEGVVTGSGATPGQVVTATLPNGATATGTAGPNGTFTLSAFAPVPANGETVSVSAPTGVAGQNPETGTTVAPNTTGITASIDALGVVTGSGATPGQVVTATLPNGATATGIAGPNGTFTLSAFAPVPANGETVSVSAPTSVAGQNPETGTTVAQNTTGITASIDANGVVTGSGATPGQVVTATLPNGATATGTAGPNGTFTLSAFAPVPANGETVSVSAPTGVAGQNPETVSALAPNTTGITASIDASGVVTGSGATPGQVVTATLPNGATATGTAGPNGTFTLSAFAPVPANGETVSVSAPTGVAGQPAETGTTVAPNTTGITASIDASGVVTGTGATPGQVVTATLPNGATATGTAGANGAFTLSAFDPVPTNGETVSISAPTGVAGQNPETASALAPNTTGITASIDASGVVTGTGATPGQVVTATLPNGATATGTAGADGSFTLSAFAPVPANGETVSISAPTGVANQPAETATTLAPNTTGITATISPEGVVTGSGATPGQVVTATLPNGATATGTAGADGSFTLSAFAPVPTNGETVSISAPTGVAGKNPETASALAPNTTGITASIDASGVVTGTGATPGQLVTATLPNGATATGTAGADGAFTLSAFDPVPTNGETVSISAPTGVQGQNPETATTLAPDNTQMTASITPEGVVSGTGATPGAVVTASLPSGATATGTANADGTYTLSAFNPAPVKGETVNVSAPHAAGAPETTTVTAYNEAPVADLSTGSGTEDSTTVTGDVSGNVTHKDGTETYALDDPLTATGAHGSLLMNADGSWTYTRTANLNAIQAAVEETFTYRVTDSAGNHTTAALKITLDPVNDAANIAGDVAAEITETNAAESASGTLTIADVDSAATFVAASNVAGSGGYGKFTLTTAGAWTYVMNSAQDQFVLGSDYTDSFTAMAADGTSQVVTVTIHGTNDSPVVQPRSSNTNTPVSTYTENSTAQYISNGTLYGDADTATLTGAKIQISNMVAGDALKYTSGTPAALVFAAPTDNGSTVVYALPFGITATYTKATGLMELTGTATKAEYSNALKSIQFVSTSDNPTGITLANPAGDTPSRTITWQINDGQAANNWSEVANSTVNITAANDKPVVGTADGYMKFFTENGGAVSANNAITLTDLDADFLTGATVQLDVSAGVTPGDVLAFTAISGVPITASSYDAATGLLTLTGNATVAQYQEALRAVTFNNTTENPASMGITRSVKWQVNDGFGLSIVKTTQLSMISKNDAPVLDATVDVQLPTVLASLGVQAAAPVGAVGTLVSDLVGGVSDADGASALKGISVIGMNRAHGVGYFSLDGGTSWTLMDEGQQVSISKGRMLKADGLTRVYYAPAADFAGTVADAFMFRAWDQTGNASTNASAAGTQFSTGTNGGVTPYSEATDTISITVRPVPPTLTVNDSDADGKINASGSALIGSTVKVTWPDGSTSTTLTGASGNWSVESPTVQAEGEVKAEASVGSTTSDQVAANYTDSTPPTVAITEPVTQNTNGTLTVSGTGEAGASVVVKAIDGSTVGTATVLENGTWTLTSAGPVKEGTLTATATDINGEVGTDTAAYVDNTPPAIPTLDAVDSDANGKINASGTAEPFSTVLVTWPNGTGTQVSVGASGVWQVESTGVQPRGTVSAKTMDMNGQVSDSKTAPYATVTNLDVVDTNGNGKPTVSGETLPNLVVTIKDPFGAEHTVTAGADGKFSLEIDPAPSQLTGDYTATAAYGVGHTTNPVTVNETDLTAPVISGLDVNDADVDGKPTISGHVDTPNVVVTIKDPAGATHTVTAGPDGNFSLEIEVAQGSVNGDYTVTAVDAAGNTSLPESKSYSAFVPLTINEPMLQNTDGTMTVSGTGEIGATVVVKDVNNVEIGTATIVDNGQGVGTWTVTSSGPVPEGTLSASATVGTNPPSTDTAFYENKPVAVNDLGSGTEDSTTLTGNVSSNDTHKDGSEVFTLNTSPTGTYGSLALAADGTWEYTRNTTDLNGITAFVQDSFTYKVTDNAGNESTATLTIKLNPVNDGPTISVSGAYSLFNEDGGPVAAYKESVTSVILADVDSSHLSGATVKVNHQTTNLFVTGDLLTFTTASGSAIEGAYDAMTGILTFTGLATVAEYQTVLNSVKFNNLRDDIESGPRRITWTVTDAEGQSNQLPAGLPVRSYVGVTQKNDAPVLLDTNLVMPNVQPTAAELPQGSMPTGLVGVLVSSLLGGSSDADGNYANVYKGIAVVGVNKTLGELYFSLNGGASWFSYGASATLSEQNALLLKAGPSARVYFRPHVGVEGNIAEAFTFRSWDASDSGVRPTMSGVQVNTYPITVTGGTSAYSTATDTVALNVDTTATPGFTGTSGDDVMVGTAGNDVMVGNGGADQFSGDAGNDQVVLNAANVAALSASNAANVDGGTGINTLKLSGADMLLDLSNATVHGKVHNFSTIDVVGNGNNTLKLGLADVQTLSGAADNATTTDVNEAQMLVVKGNDGDAVVLENTANWSQVMSLKGADLTALYGVDHGFVTDHLYSQYTHSGATLFVDELMAVADLVGSTDANVLTGTNNADVIFGNGGADTITAGDGNDKVLLNGRAIADLSSSSMSVDINGGAGVNTLSIFGRNLTLDLSDVTVSDKVHNFSILDMHQGMGNTIKVSLQEVLNMSAGVDNVNTAVDESKMLVVQGNGGLAVNKLALVDGANWSAVSNLGGTTMINTYGAEYGFEVGRSYTQYTNGAANLFVDQTLIHQIL